MRFHKAFSLIVPLLVAQNAIAGPPPACGGNICYPILVGPLKDIAKEFCSYYLGYPRTTFTTAKSTTTSIRTITAATPTASVTTTTSVTSFATATTTIPGALVTSTVTTTATITAAAAKRDVDQRDVEQIDIERRWSPPKGSGSGYKPPQLERFAPQIISAACLCLVTPTTKTVTATSVITASSTTTFTPATVTQTVATATVTVSSTITSTATLPPSTTTVTTTSFTTTTEGPPAPACTNVGVPGGGLCGCTYTTVCNLLTTGGSYTFVIPFAVGSESECRSYSDNTEGAFVYNYTPSIGQCILNDGEGDTTTVNGITSGYVDTSCKQACTADDTA